MPGGIVDVRRSQWAESDEAGGGRTDELERAARVAVEQEVELERLRRRHLAERVARVGAVAAQQRLAFLDGLSAQLAAQVSTPELALAVVGLAVPAVADFAAIYLVRDGTLALVASAGPPSFGEAAAAHLGVGPTSGLARAAAGAAIAEAGVAAGAGEEPLSAVAVPLAIAGRFLGALLLVSPEAEGRHGPAAVALAADVARRAALALDHARLLGEANAVARAREEFLHVASHELRGPIGTLRMAVQLLLRDFRSGERSDPERRLRLIERQADRLVRLGEALLDVSRITSGRLELARETADLAAIAREVAGRFSDESADAQSPILCEAVAPLLAPVDAARVEQVLSNLLSNALKYGRGAPIHVRACAEGGRALLSVVDAGIGIAEADQTRIFGRFERAVSSRNYAGLGLGLWIALRIAEAHGGTIRVVSAPGRGSTFTVDLPLASLPE